MDLGVLAVTVPLQFFAPLYVVKEERPRISRGFSRNKKQSAGDFVK